MSGRGLYRRRLVASRRAEAYRKKFGAGSPGSRRRPPSEDEGAWGPSDGPVEPGWRRDGESSEVMPDKSPRRLKLEQGLVENPGDAFLRYGLAMQCLRDGDVDEGRRRLRSLIEDDPDRQIAAYQQLGQSYAESEEFEEAAAILRTGVARARAAGDSHAAAEMEQILESLG